MMVHLFLEDGSHRMFKEIQYVENGRAVTITSPQQESVTTLYVYPEYLGYFERERMFKLVPTHRVKEIHMTREAGKSWGA